MIEPTPIVFYVPSDAVATNGDGTIDTATLLARIGADDIAHRHADLHGARWAGLDINASAQPCGDQVRLVVELSSMDWIEMRLRHPDNSPMHPERSRHLIDAFADAADALDCRIGFKSMMVLPEGWANWDVFLPDFDRIAGHRRSGDLVRELVDFGYAAADLDGLTWDVTSTDNVSMTVHGSTRGRTTAKGTIWLGDRLPAMT